MPRLIAWKTNVGINWSYRILKIKINIDFYGNLANCVLQMNCGSLRSCTDLIPLADPKWGRRTWGLAPPLAFLCRCKFLCNFQGTLTKIMDWAFTRCVGGPVREILDPPLHTLANLILSSFLNDDNISMEIWLSL